MKLHLDPQALLQEGRTTRLREAQSSRNADALREKCQEFEAVFIQTLFKEMRSTVPDGGLLPKGMKEDVFRDFMDMHVAREAAKESGLGIADALFTQLQQIEQTRQRSPGDTSPSPPGMAKPEPSGGA